jgi:hypothetical protein
MTAKITSQMKMKRQTLSRAWYDLATVLKRSITA